MFRKLILASALSLCAVAAFALPKPSEVKAAVASGNYVKAETMLLEVMREKPSARAHYDLGQVYSFQGKHIQALNEFRQAQALDPSLKFASSSAAFTKQLVNEQNMVAPPPQVPQLQPLPIPDLHTATAPAPAPAPKQSEGGAAGFLIFLLLLVGVAAAAFFLLRKKTQTDMSERTSANKASMASLLEFAKKLEDATLITKTATYSKEMQKKILARITALQTQVRNALADIRDGKEMSASRLATIETNVVEVVEQSEHGISEPVPEPVRTYTPRTEVNLHPAVARPAPAAPYVPVSVAPAPRERVVHHYVPTPAPYIPAPAPSISDTIIGTATGMLIADALTDHHRHERTVIVEREAPHRFDSPTVQEDSYERAPTPAPVLDTSDDDNDSYNSPAPSVDSAPAADDNY